MMKASEKGMWKRTVLMFTKFRVPWHLYLMSVILGAFSTKVALLYIPYYNQMKTGDIQDFGIVINYILLQLLTIAANFALHINDFYARNMVSRNLKNRLLGRSLRMPMSSFDRYGSQLVSWISKDCDYSDGLITAVVSFITGGITTIMTMNSISALDKGLLILVPVVFVYVLLTTWAEGRFLFLRQRKGREASAKLTAFFSEHLSFITEIRQLHSEKEELDRGSKAIDEYYKADIYQAVITLINNFVSGPIVQVISIMIFVLGVPMVNRGEMTLTELATFESYILLIYQSFSSLPRIYVEFMYYNGQFFFISQLMAEQEETYQREFSMDMPDEDLRFEHVTFSYDAETEPVLNDVSFTIPKGKVTAIVGPNGSGKTTVFRLLQRFYEPTSGQICFGDLPVEKIHLDRWRENMTYVLQEPRLFNGTVRENINYSVKRQVSPEETEAAARLASADVFIREFPEGYETVIGENGGNLSGGQRQRLAIARALIMDPSYLMLDEATCSMDLYSEQEVMDAVMKLMEGRTTIMITHDMEELSRADHIIVLNRGNVEAEGDQETVLLKSPTLRRLKAGADVSE